ncbi:GPN-loop GTPase 1 [Trichomonascus vanleenenianus]|uniref:GTPase NPA3 n=1 Tax=Trichomonascus vanleenenianus TaxID=2268995 RepID=UPI003EC99D17
MAGSGKTTFMQRLNSQLHSKKRPPYVINLDPAVNKVPFGTNIDIRDSVNYKKVMKDYNLGPNGAIMTSLNLFSTKIDQVLGIIEKRAPQVDHVIIDTPGQIECFIWSASGAIITDALASSFPTVIAYIVDTPRTASPATFMSNMLYACSILYKTKLPMIIVFNKTDVKDAGFAKEWMSDFEKFQQVLRDDEELNGEGENSSGYMGSLMNSLSLMLEEFYRHLDVVGVSAYTGQGFDEFLAAVDNKVEEFNRDYKAERDEILKKREEEAAKKKTKDLTRLMKDIGIKDQGGEEQVDSISDTEDVLDEEDEGAGLVERDEFEGGREYDLPDRKGEINSSTDKGIQDRYKEALKATDDEREAVLKHYMEQINR